MKIDNVAVGADPELFIINEVTNKVVSAVGLIPGEKENPYIADDMPAGFGLQTDNILAEFNIPPTRSKEEFVNNIEYMKQYINKYVKEINPNYGILCAASKVVDPSQLKSKQAQEFGCSIDYNVYTESPNPKPEGKRTRIRSAGFHLHISYDNPNIDYSLLLIKYLDMYLGLPSVLIDLDTKRRALYGKAGCFRLKPYGLEYRVLSSYMMSSIPILNKVWEQLMRAIEAFNNGGLLISSSKITQAINKNNIELAKQLIEEYNIE